MTGWWARLSHDGRVFALALLAGAPAVVTCLALLWFGPYSMKAASTLTVLVLCVWVGAATATRAAVVRPLQTLANLLAAVREGDYSLRSTRAGTDDALGTVMGEVNLLAGTLRAQRLGAVEASALLRQVMAEIDVAVFAFDEDRHLRLINAAGCKLLDVKMESATHRSARELGLEDLLDDPAPRTQVRAFPGGRGPWELRRTVFRQDGRPHHLVVLADLRRALREEEQQAWKRLVRVLGHEINNSLAPIQSLTQSLGSMVARPARPDGWEADVQRGLAVVGRRAEALGRFMSSYTRLARLPPPHFAPVELAACVQRVVRLEERLAVRMVEGAQVVLNADADQIEQLLINLVKNAVEASSETGGGVEVAWKLAEGRVEITVADEGPGLPTTDNLFVLFFTTKPTGSGIGSVLSRQIAESHGGSLTLEAREGARGCVARLHLPVRPLLG